MKSLNRPLALLVVSIAIARGAYAQDIMDENQLFADTATVTQAPVMADTQRIGDYSGRKSVGLSGTVTSAAMAAATRDFRHEAAFPNTALGTWITGDILLDVRLKGGFKAFGSMETTYRPDAGGAGGDSGLSFSLPELFVDANIRNKLYFRTGKQVLQWGRCYFWNPTDLVNIEQKPFIQKVGLREGTYGVKLHIPSGTARNFYGFLGTYGATRPDQVSLAAKYEFLLGGTEMALSVWGKRRHNPVYGYDVSSRLAGIDISGELGLHQRYRLKTISFATGRVSAEMKHWVPRACLGLGRSFTVGQIKDRLATTIEFYYNYVGSTDRTIEFLSNPAFLAAVRAGSSSGATAETLTGFLIANGYYQPNSYSRFYSAFFASFGKFIIPDITLNLNAIGNLDQRCAIVTTALSYTTLSDFSLGLSINGYLGPDNTEYTVSNAGVQVQLTAGLSF